VNQIGGYVCECASGRSGDPYSPNGCATAKLPPGGKMKLVFYAIKITSHACNYNKF
jgi:hypothetical protein